MSNTHVPSLGVGGGMIEVSLCSKNCIVRIIIIVQNTVDGQELPVLGYVGEWHDFQEDMQMQKMIDNVLLLVVIGKTRFCNSKQHTRLCRI